VKSLRHLYFRAFLGALLLPCLGTAAVAETQTMTYDVYAGGIHALDAKLSIETDKKKYTTRLDSATHGLLKTLAPWSGSFSSKGNLGKDKTPLPLEHLSSSTWKDETEEKRFTYDGKGHFVSYKVTEGGKDKTPDDIDKTLTEGATDLLSATLELLLALPSKQDCKGESLIFDGNRNFKLVFKETSLETLKKSKYNIFDGQTVSCQVEVIPEKGKWRKKPRGWLSIQEQGRQKGALPQIWLGKMDGATTYIPVKVRVKTNYGTLFLHLTSHTKS